MVDGEGEGEDYTIAESRGVLRRMSAPKGGHILPLFMLDEVLGNKSKFYTAPGICVVVRTRHPGWVKALGKAAKSMGDWKYVHEPVANVRHRDDRESEALDALSRGERVLCVGSRAEGSIPARLLAAADIAVEIDEVSVEAVSRAIRSATKSRPRGLKPEDVAGIDLVDAMIAIRANTTAASCLKRIRAVKSTPSLDPWIESAPPVSELVGYGEARVWADRLIKDIELWRRGELPFTALQRNAVLAGEPGVGKSSFVRSLAKSTGLPLITSSVGQMFATSAGYLDSIVKSIDQLFADARAAGDSAIVFIDELEGIPSRESLQGGREGSWWTPVVNHFLTSLDSAMSSASNQLIVIGATNFPDRLDAALVRPGRLDRVIWIDKPDADELAQIYRQHLGEDLAGEDLGALGHLAIDSTGADVVGHIKSARAIARAKAEPLSLSHLVEVICPPSLLPPDALHRAAIHEAGHAVAAIVLGGHEVLNMVIGGKHEGGRVTFRRPVHSLGSSEEKQKEVVKLLSGRAAEEALLGSVSAGAGGAVYSDLGRATGIVASNRLSFGLGGTLAYLGEPEEALAFLRRSPLLLKMVEEELQQHYRAAIELVNNNEAAIRAVADALVRNRTLTGDAVRTIVSGNLKSLRDRHRA